MCVVMVLVSNVLRELMWKMVSRSLRLWDSANSMRSAAARSTCTTRRGLEKSQRSGSRDVALSTSLLPSEHPILGYDGLNNLESTAFCFVIFNSEMHNAKNSDRGSVGQRG